MTPDRQHILEQAAKQLATRRYLTVDCPNAPCDSSCPRCRGWQFIIVEVPNEYPYPGRGHRHQR